MQVDRLEMIESLFLVYLIEERVGASILLPCWNWWFLCVDRGLDPDFQAA